MIYHSLYIDKSPGIGRGVFTSQDIDQGVLIETSPVVVMSQEERKLLDKTLLHDYIFEWGEKSDQCCMALGYIAVYNHSYKSNCEYEMNYRDQSISIRTVRQIKAGDELFINYNGDWDNEKRVWFDVIVL